LRPRTIILATPVNGIASPAPKHASDAGIVEHIIDFPNDDSEVVASVALDVQILGHWRSA
jgi:hypothetical protein